MESRTGEALGFGLRVNGDAAWAPLVLAMAEMESVAWLVFHRVRVGCAEVLLLHTHDLMASNGRDALEFRASQLDMVFSQLGMVVRNENEKKSEV